MEKIHWKQKLTSRKFWTAVVSFVALLVVALGGTEAQATQITALIMAGATVVAYIVGEGMIDAASAGAPTTISNDTGTVRQDESTASRDTVIPPKVSKPQTVEEALHAAFPDLDNVTVEQVNTAIEATSIVLSKTTNDKDKAQLTSALAALKMLRAAKVTASGPVALSTNGAV